MTKERRWRLEAEISTTKDRGEPRHQLEIRPQCYVRYGCDVPGVLSASAPRVNVTMFKGPEAGPESLEGVFEGASRSANQTKHLISSSCHEARASGWPQPHNGNLGMVKANAHNKQIRSSRLPQSHRSLSGCTFHGRPLAPLSAVTVCLHTSEVHTLYGEHRPNFVRIHAAVVNPHRTTSPATNLAD